MNTSKIIKGVVSNGKYTVTAPIVKEDYGLYLQIEGVELPSTYEVDFSNSENIGTSVTMIGNADGVLIPRQFISTGKDVFAFLYHVGADYGRTVYKFRIPNKVRPDRTNEEPTPEEQSTIDQAISALNSAVAATAQDVIDAAASVSAASQSESNAHDSELAAQGYASDARGYATTASQKATAAGQSEEAARGYAQTASEKADAITGLTATATTLPDGSSATASYDAETGVMSFGIPKGKDGTDGIDGISPSVSVTDITGGHRVVITDESGSKTFDVMDGATGATPNLTIGTVETLEPTESATATITGTPENPVLNLGIPQGDTGEVSLADLNTALMDKADIITDTTSGSIASFSDGADNLPLKSLVVDINPVQDLHGQDAPYPAGGGKNLLPDLQGARVTNSIYIGQTDGTTFPIHLSANTAYTVSVTINSGATGAVVYMKQSGGSNIKFADLVNGQGTYTPSTDMDVQMWVYAVGLTSVSKFQLEKGSTATSYAPYENICPISGLDSVNVWDDPAYGGNIKWNSLLRYDNAVATYSKYGVTFKAASNGLRLLTSGTYVYSSGDRNAYIFNNMSRNYLQEGHKYLFTNTSKYYCVYVYGADNPTATVTGNIVNKNNQGGVIVTCTSAGRYRLSLHGGTNIPNNTVMNEEIVVCGFDLTEMFGTGKEPTTVDEFKALFPKDYYPFDDSYTETLVSAVNGDPYRHVTIDLGQTVYGGHLDVLSGELTVYPYYASYNGETLTGEWISDRDKYVAGTTPTIGAQVVNIGAQGVTVQLEPHEVESLHGVNNIWADSGDTEVVYRADTKAWVQRKIAEAISALS